MKHPDVASFELALRAEGKKPKTISTYAWTAQKFMESTDKPVGDIGRDDVRAFIVTRMDAVSTGAVNVEARSLRSYLRWLSEEGLTEGDLSSYVKPPKAQPKDPVALSTQQVEAVVAMADGPTMWQRRDAAFIRVLADCGLRLSECVSLRVGDIDLAKRTVTVHGTKSDNGVRLVGFGHKTARAIDRYLRFRRGHESAHLACLWLGKDGCLGTSGAGQMVRSHMKRAGVRGSAHSLRHYWADSMLRSGVPESSVVLMGGWASTQMLVRQYGRTVEADRALATYKSPMDDS